MSRMVSFFVLVGIILVIGALFFRVMATFLVPLFFATVLVVVFRPLHRKMQQRCQGREHLAAGLTTAVIMLIVLVPAILVLTLAIVEGTSLLRDPDVAVASVKVKLTKLRQRLDLDRPLAEEVRRIETAFNKLYAQQSWSALSREEPDPAAETGPHASAYLLALVGDLQQQIAAARPREEPVSLEPVVAKIRELDEQPPGSLAFATVLEEAMEQFEQAKTELYGGSFQAWLVELANPSDEDLRRWSEHALRVAQNWLLAVGGATTAFAARLALGVLVMMLSVYFFLLEGPSMAQSIMRLSPLDDRYEQELLQEFNQLSRAVVVATVLSAVVQGLLAGIGY
jgi:predicted PurR-regulated permease PerM